jgi:type II secretory pathway component PulF
MSSSAEREQLIENISMLVDSGIDVLSALDASLPGLQSKKIRKVVEGMQEDLENGSPFWRAFERSKLFPQYVVSLVKVGEESGKLPENLKIVILQNEKTGMLRSRLISAVLYPIVVVAFMTLVGSGVGWFILPKLASSFSNLNIPLPAITQVLIALGGFLGLYGAVVIPGVLIAVALLCYFLFSFPKTRYLGDAVLLHTPIIKDLMRDTEIAQFGYITGILVKSGISLTDALHSVADITSLRRYQQFYSYLADSITDGNSFKNSFKAYPRTASLITAPIEQMIISAEQAGKLPDVFLRFSKTFEDKTETLAKNLPVVIEPVLLIVVGLVVFLFAISVILPIYSLIGGIAQ